MALQYKNKTTLISFGPAGQISPAQAPGRRADADHGFASFAGALARAVSPPARHGGTVARGGVDADAAAGEPAPAGAGLELSAALALPVSIDLLAIVLSNRSCCP